MEERRGSREGKTNLKNLSVCVCEKRSVLTFLYIVYVLYAYIRL